MEKKNLTPEQHEMEVYESYLECFGEEDVISITLHTVQEAEECFQVLSAMEAIRNSPINSPVMRCWAREHIARLQVYLNMMELIFGDTADEADAMISGLNEILVGHGAM